MKDKYARQLVEDYSSEWRKQYWELKHMIWEIHKYLGVEPIVVPGETKLVKKDEPKT